MRDDIVVLMRSGNGYFDHDRLSLRHLKNIVPSIGDRLTLHLDDEGLAVYRVEQRYLVDLRFADDGRDDSCFWALVVEQYPEDHSSEFDLTVRAIHRAEFHDLERCSNPSCTASIRRPTARPPKIQTHQPQDERSGLLDA